MSGRTSPQEIDSLLLPLLSESDLSALQCSLSDLVSKHAEPIIKEIIKHKLRLVYDGLYSSQLQESEDICSNAILSLLARLKEFRDDPGNKAIGNFRSYAATVAYNAFNEYLRSRYPQRHSLKNKLRYIFSHHKELAVWEGGNRELLCGLAGWQEQVRTAATVGEVNHLRDNHQQLFKTGGLPQREKIAEIAVAVVNFFHRPVELDDMVCLVAELAKIREKTVRLGGDLDDSNTWESQIADASMPVDEAVDMRLYIEHLWKEICQLPPRQRCALLLNLKDGHGNSRLEMFWLMNVATMRQIAGALEMSDLDFAALRNELPLEDAAIAQRLHLTRQQVINLRKSARERLTRRMKPASF